MISIMTGDKRVTRARLLMVLTASMCVCCLVSYRHSVAQVLTIYESDDPAKSGLDPYTGWGPVSERFVSLYCRPLFQFAYIVEHGPDEYRDNLAESMELADGDARRVLIAIRKDAYFYSYSKIRKKYRKDSIPVTAHDVVVTYKNLINPQSELRSTWFADRLKKAVSKIEAISRDTLLVVFRSDRKPPRQPKKVLDFPIVPAAAVPEGPILESPARNSFQAEYIKKPWASGPYVLRDILKPAGNKKFWFERVAADDGGNFKEIHIRIKDYDHMLERLNHLDEEKDVCIPSVPIGMRNEVDQGYVVEELYYPHVEQIMFNTRRVFLKDSLVRRALSVYIDRETLVNVYKGEAYIVNGPMPWRYIYYCKDCDIPYYTHNPALGDSLLETAGWQKDLSSGKWLRDGQPLRVEILGYAGTPNSYVSQIVNHLETGWQAYGVEARGEIVAPGEYWRRLKNGKFDAAFHRLSYHVLPELKRYFVTDGRENYSGFNDRVVDSLWGCWPTVSIPGVRPLWHKLHDRIGRMVPGAFLWTPQDYAVYSGWISVGQDFFPHNFIGVIEEWEFEK